MSGNLLISKGDLAFLWHPGTENTFSGYGLALQAGRKDILVGLLMVDRPEPVTPAWLAQVGEMFGEYQLAQMTRTGEKGISCLMWVENSSLAYVRGADMVPKELAGHLSQVLKPLLKLLPKPKVRVRWNETSRFWVSEFQVPRFPLGMTVMTPGAINALRSAGETPEQLFVRHQSGDWGNLDEEDKKENEFSVDKNLRIFSAYILSTGVKVWVITEADRSVTTILLPSEY